MNEPSNEPKRIGVIGPTQSGKTCLAVGLFSTNTSGFTIETVGMIVRSYLSDLRAALQPGRDDSGNRKAGLWPAATNMGTKMDISLDFQKKGKAPVRVEFPDFSGELLADEETFRKFANQYLRDLSGVVLLMNPGADAFQSGDAKKLADAMTQYKRVVDFLKDPNNGSADAFVALTVTAADRLKGDLRGKLEAFEQTVEELSNSIETAKFRCKRFNVSITGHLKEQDDPQLARGRKNSASEPFLWLLDELDWRPRRIALVRKIRRCALAAVAAAALVGIWYGVSAMTALDEINKDETKTKEVLDECLSRTNPGEEDLAAVRNGIIALQSRTGWFSKKARDAADAFRPTGWTVHEKRIRREWSNIAADPVKYGRDCDRVDKVFQDWSIVDPDDPGAAALKAQWNAERPGFQEQYAIGQLLEIIRKPLDESAALHGAEAFALFAGLYGKLSAVSPVSTNTVALKAELSAQLDARVEKEWREFAIPDFEKAAPQEATHETTRAFAARLADWNPATTNGLAAKDALMASVSNSVPVWRTDYETTTFSAHVDDAVKGGSLEALAALFPARVVTNDYLTAQFVGEQWAARGKPAFDKSRKAYLDGIVADVVRRGGRPELTSDDKARIESSADAVGEPFDGAGALASVQQDVDEKERAWENACRAAAEQWIKDEIRANPNRKRTGNNGLWDAYERFVRENRDNPFVESLVRPAVYTQAERWFESDIRTFSSMEHGNAGYKGLVEDSFDSFKRLCRRIDEDKNPLRTSWAWHFATACVEKGHLESVATCFPQTLAVSRVEGTISYGDFRVGYKGTDLTAKLGVETLDGEANEIVLVSEQTLQKADNGQWKPLQFSSLSIVVHPFDVLDLKLKANDRNRGGRNLDGDAGHVSATSIQLSTRWPDGVECGGEFDLRKNLLVAGGDEWWSPGLTTKDPTPDAYVKVYARLTGDSILDFAANAKRAAEREKIRQ